MSAATWSIHPHPNRVKYSAPLLASAVTQTRNFTAPMPFGPRGNGLSYSGNQLRAVAPAETGRSGGAVERAHKQHDTLQTTYNQGKWRYDWSIETKEEDHPTFVHPLTIPFLCSLFLSILWHAYFTSESFATAIYNSVPMFVMTQQDIWYAALFKCQGRLCLTLMSA